VVRAAHTSGKPPAMITYAGFCSFCFSSTSTARAQSQLTRVHTRIAPYHPLLSDDSNRHLVTQIRRPLMAKEVYVVRIAPPVIASTTNYKPCLRFTARGESRPYLNIDPPKTRLNCLQMFPKRTPFRAGSFVKRRSEKYQGGRHVASSKERRLIFRLVLN
jgi:hypothetical protein